MEIVYPANRIVIPYDFEGLVLLSAYAEDGSELPRGALESAAAVTGMRITRTISCESFAALMEVTKALPSFEEGFVLRFSNGLRLKLKGDAYCRLHRLISHCTPLALWEAMMQMEDIELIRRELPEEMQHDFDMIRGILNKRFTEILGAADTSSLLHCLTRTLASCCRRAHRR